MSFGFDSLKVFLGLLRENLTSGEISVKEILGTQILHSASAYVSGHASPKLSDKLIDKIKFLKRKIYRISHRAFVMNTYIGSGLSRYDVVMLECCPDRCKAKDAEYTPVWIA